MSDEFGRVVVLGSLNLDRRLELERLPSPGETVAARDASTGPGGQVVASDRHAADHVGTLVGQGARELVEGLARVEGVGAEDRAPLAG
ncbi:MAG: ribokinase, partial [Acidimicrobiales bacterium]